MQVTLTFPVRDTGLTRGLYAPWTKAEFVLLGHGTHWKFGMMYRPAAMEPSTTYNGLFWRGANFRYFRG